ncbi:hypothetical protein QAD02_000571 [Eretmocerus hayati]|uniref:Uncharacterized protein n=1 Tax=Eretmocerus hayati TaxID=131215 RepID=A0ACC2NGD5_9HYME|nr:hypothetical protein QAD02_000571 [Eretmocerus hayati]
MEMTTKCNNRHQSDKFSANNSIERVSNRNVYVFEWTVKSSSVTSAEFRSLQSPNIVTGDKCVWQLELERSSSSTKKKRDNCQKMALHAKLISLESETMTSASFALAVYQHQTVDEISSRRSCWLQQKACSVNGIRPGESAWLDSLDIVSLGCYVHEWFRLRIQITDEGSSRIYPDLQTDDLQKHSHTVQRPIGPGLQTLEYLSSRDLSDVTLIVEDQEIFANKVVLAAHSPVLRSMFLDQKSTNGKFLLSDVDSQAMRQLVDLMYSFDGHLPLSMNCSPENILCAAKKYQVDWVIDICVTEILNSLCIDNACKILTLADFYKIEKLKSKALSFIVDNVDRVIETHGFRVMEEARKKLSRDVMFAVAQRMKQLKI